MPWRDAFAGRSDEAGGDAAERAYRRRLRDALGINAAGLDVILHLRRQLLALQARVRQLEAELASRESGQQARLLQYRHACFEAVWREAPNPEEQP
jgi:hypothetical protein